MLVRKRKRTIVFLQFIAVFEHVDNLEGCATTKQQFIIVFIGNIIIQKIYVPSHSCCLELISFMDNLQASRRPLQIPQIYGQDIYIQRKHSRHTSQKSPPSQLILLNYYRSVQTHSLRTSTFFKFRCSEIFALSQHINMLRSRRSSL